MVFLEDIDDFLQEFVLDLLYRRWAGSQKYSKGKNLGFGRIQQFGSLKVPGLFLLEVRTQPNNYNRIQFVTNLSKVIKTLLNWPQLEANRVRACVLSSKSRSRSACYSNKPSLWSLLSFQIKFEQATTRLMMYSNNLGYSRLPCSAQLKLIN